MAPVSLPFFDPGSHAEADRLAILQLRRDLLYPAVLAPDGESDYAEGKVENTRFGSFPHSTLTNQPWGMQVLASVVDTGSRGKSKKRKRDGDSGPPACADEAKKDVVKAAIASSGFAHLIYPTPETWTLSLPHRTQVVYTPDYSYVLQRLRARPGDHIIEAGAGSGSFTHAAARAVYNGCAGQDVPAHALDGEGEHAVGMTKRHTRKRRQGGVFSYEFHEPRSRQLRAELTDHGLDPLVTVTHRDVCKDGFCLENNTDTGGTAPDADTVFLDLPQPWLALPHLARSRPSPDALRSITSDSSVPSPDIEPDNQSTASVRATKPFRSPLNPSVAVRICTFSPCIEQVIKTVAALRTLGWVDIDMVEIAAKRLDVRRERIGLAEEGVRTGNASPATVQEAVQRSREVEGRAAVFHSLQKEKQEEIMRKAEAKKRGKEVGADEQGEPGGKKRKMEGAPPSKHERALQNRKDAEHRTLYKEGRLVHRTEPELKTHTSYLVFAVLPREWTKEDEDKARKKYSTV